MGLDWHLQNKKDGTTPRMHVAEVMGMKPGNDDGVLDFLMEEERWRWFRDFVSLRESEDVSRDQVSTILNESEIAYVEAWENRESYPKDAIAYIQGVCCGDFDFRGKAVARNSLVPNDERAECYMDMMPERMIKFGLRLWNTVDASLTADDMPVPQSDEEIGELSESHPEVYYLSRAAKWLIFWGKAGFEMKTSY